MNPQDHAPFADVSPRVRRMILGLGVAVTLAGTIGFGLLPWLSARHPMILLALAPNYLGLVAPRVEFAPAYLLVASRRLVGMCAIYGFGGLFGEGALGYLARERPRMHSILRWTASRFQRYGSAFVVLFPGVMVSLVAGVSGMSPRRFALTAALAQLIWTAVYFRFSMVIAAFSGRVLRLLESHLVEASVIFLLLVTLQQLNAKRNRQRASLADDASAKRDGSA